MFEKKIEEAAKASRQKFLLLVMSCTIILLAFIVFLLLPGFFKSDTGHDGGSGTAQTPAPIAEPKHVETPEATKAAGSKSANFDSEQLREQREVTALVGRYEDTLEPTVQTAGFAAWDQDRQHDLIQGKKDVITKLASGNIDGAYNDILDLIEQADTSIATYRDAVQIAIAEAEAALAGDNYQLARTAIDRALLLDGNDRKAQDLKQKIDALPELLDLIDRVRVAAVENNLEKERDLLQQILEKDPSRSGFRDRLNEINSLLTERRYEQVIANGLQAHRTGKVKELASAYDRAKGIFPSREETENLASLLISLKREIAFDNFVIEATAAMEADDWQQAHKGFEKALTIHSDDQEARNGLEMSKSILNAKREISAYLGKPERLSTDTVKNAALKAVTDAEIFGALSQSLQSEMGQLLSQIEKMNREIDVLIISDKSTLVSVKGVGRVGQVDRYSIRLKPGAYVFEGKREGFRTKLVPITIRPEDNAVRVEVITDERI